MTDANYYVGNSDELTLTTYDGEGQPIYDIVFKNLSFQWHSSQYKYESSEEVNHNVTLAFGAYEKKLYRLTEMSEPDPKTSGDSSQPASS